MGDAKVREELAAVIKRGEQAKDTLAKLDALDAVEQADHQEAFRERFQADSAFRHDVKQKNPELYLATWRAIGEQSLNKLNQGGR